MSEERVELRSVHAQLRKLTSDRQLAPTPAHILLQTLKCLPGQSSYMKGINRANPGLNIPLRRRNTLKRTPQKIWLSQTVPDTSQWPVEEFKIGQD